MFPKLNDGRHTKMRLFAFLLVLHGAFAFVTTDVECVHLNDVFLQADALTNLTGSLLFTARTQSRQMWSWIHGSAEEARATVLTEYAKASCVGTSLETMMDREAAMFLDPKP